MTLRDAREIMEEAVEAERMEEMSKNAFNPQFDFLLQYPNGQEVSSVYGKIWRYCQMNKGKCEASKERMAEELNMDIRVFRKYINWLLENGLVYDLTPARGKHIPHTYQVNRDEHLRQTVAYNEYRGMGKSEMAWEGYE